MRRCSTGAPAQHERRAPLLHVEATEEAHAEERRRQLAVEYDRRDVAYRDTADAYLAERHLPPTSDAIGRHGERRLSARIVQLDPSRLRARDRDGGRAGVDEEIHGPSVDASGRDEMPACV